MVSLRHRNMFSFHFQTPTAPPRWKVAVGGASFSENSHIKQHAVARHRSEDIHYCDKYTTLRFLVETMMGRFST